ncbi:MAG: carboxypeptidase-like regulatory domain-containing protein [Candidatus Poseidoniaceae archaeon]|nr:carboxypeptidase-like regulatory domain-containing protein [Candidatus Poseidoniaceae archaeon]
MDREARLSALRSRVRSTLDAEQEEDLVVESVPGMTSLSDVERLSVQSLTWADGLEEDDSERIRMVAAVLIFVGSVLGILSGLLLLQGNPVDLLAAELLETNPTVDLRMQALEAESGNALEGLTVEWLDLETETVLQTTMTGSSGWFLFEGVTTEPRLLRVTGDGYVTSEIEMQAQAAGSPPVTMTPGSGTERIEMTQGSDEDWSLDDATKLSTAIGIATILTGAVGLLAGLEVRRAGKYRRTQYLAGIGLFSRGLILFGPALILLGMILLTFTKEQFRDWEGKERVPDFS